ncbi:PspA/IM30 family protein, partial [Candidatus Sumerlaeota bacterium]|nr:PspA/IM30 family protein [Candidatus Sumerlaeota bacterium]
RHTQRADAIAEEAVKLKETVASFQADIAQLESKLHDAREKQRSIIARHAAAAAKHQAHSSIRKVDTSEAFMRFEAYENHIERMEAGAGLVDSLRPKETLRDQFAKLEGSDEIERELERLKKQSQPS